MSDFEDMQVGDLKIRIERGLCVGFGDCVTAAPAAFRLAEDGVVVFQNPDETARETLIEACDACPVDALTVWDSAGKQIVPS